MHWVQGPILVVSTEPASADVPPGWSDWQACWADLNCGEFGSTPSPIVIRLPPPCLVGSGKFGTPWPRMHCEKASARLNSSLGEDFALGVPAEEWWEQAASEVAARSAPVAARSRVVMDMASSSTRPAVTRRERSPLPPCNP